MRPRPVPTPSRPAPPSSPPSSGPTPLSRPNLALPRPGPCRLDGHAVFGSGTPEVKLVVAKILSEHRELTDFSYVSGQRVRTLLMLSDHAARLGPPRA